MSVNYMNPRVNLLYMKNKNSPLASEQDEKKSSMAISEYFLHINLISFNPTNQKPLKFFHQKKSIQDLHICISKFYAYVLMFNI